MKYAVLSFDVEEFDLPREHGEEISLEEGVRVSSEGLEKILEIMKKSAVKATFFVTGNFAEKNPELVRRIVREGHEVACHGVDHFSPKESDLERSKNIVEKVARVKVFGYRVPRMQKIDYKKLKELGYEYDSSVNPAFIPGRYNHFKVSRKPFRKNGVVEIPTSVATRLRVPLFWLALHLFPLYFYLALAKICLRETGFFATYFHPWEFSDLSKFSSVPFYIKKNSGEKLCKRLEKVVARLKESNVEFLTYGEFCKESN